jgi:hypothetical protein
MKGSDTTDFSRWYFNFEANTREIHLRHHQALAGGTSIS